MPQPSIRHRGEVQCAGRPVHSDRRHPVRSGSHEDGNRNHGAPGGKVASVKVNAGDSVKSGQVVLEWE